MWCCFNKVQVPHYNYVGDSVLGFHAHMGAGSICSNVKADNQSVVIRAGERGDQHPAEEKWARFWETGRTSAAALC